MAYLKIIVPLILVGGIYLFWTINDICRISRTHYLPKWGWIVVTLLAIPVGGIAYYLLERLERREGSW